MCWRAHLENSDVKFKGYHDHPLCLHANVFIGGVACLVEFLQFWTAQAQWACLWQRGKNMMVVAHWDRYSIHTIPTFTSTSTALKFPCGPLWCPVITCGPLRSPVVLCRPLVVPCGPVLTKGNICTVYIWFSRLIQQDVASYFHSMSNALACSIVFTARILGSL